MSSKPAMKTVAGLPTSRGLVAGPVYLYRGGGEIAIAEFSITADQVETELARLRRSHEAVKRDLEGLAAILRERTGKSEGNVFESHLMILEDPTLVEEAARHVREDLVNAECAVRRTTRTARAMFDRMNDPYFRERVRDLDDVERRHLLSLTGAGEPKPVDLKVPSVIVADDLTPSETVLIPRDKVLGFATNRGSTTSHVALLARSLAIPAVTGLGDITERVKIGQVVLLDGTAGTVTIDPDLAASESFAGLVERQRKAESSAKGHPAGELADGSRVLIFANFYPGAPCEGVRESGAGGIGLYRSEYLWLSHENPPTEEEQLADYRKAAEFAQTLSPTATLTVRTLDIGGDKLVRGISTKEANPFLGNRSIRYLLTHRDVFRTQLRAILRASAFAPINLMHPMVSCLEELREAAIELESVRRELRSAGIPFAENMPVGAMIEVPSAALNAEALADYVDFFSIGTNDLVQYTMAADRGNEEVAHLYQPLNPAVLKLVRMTVEAARQKGVFVAVCGESASDPVIGTLWTAMGADMLSLSPAYIPIASNVLHRLSRADLDAYAAFVGSLGASVTGEEIYRQCRAFLAAKIPDFEELVDL